MRYSAEISEIFNCSLERAFKTPILGDATKFLTGYLFQPSIIAFEEDESWGRVEGYRYPVLQGNFYLRSGRIFKDQILERVENEYWKWMIYNFSSPLLFFLEHGIGKWYVNEIEPNKIQVKYKYTFTSRHQLFNPLCKLFVRIQMKGMMRKAIQSIKDQAESNLPLYYEKSKKNSSSKGRLIV